MPTPPSTTVLKAFDLLELFAERPLLGAGEAARLLGAPRASTHRLLVTLKAAGVLESNDRGQYRLGLRLFELGSFAPLRRRLHDESDLLLKRLAADVRLPAHLAVRDGMDLLYLEKVHNHEIDIPTRVGQREPLRCTAHTVVEPRRLLGELDRIRDSGTASDREEFCLGVATVGARVRNHTGKVVAAISVAGPVLRHDPRL